MSKYRAVAAVLLAAMAAGCAPAKPHASVSGKWPMYQYKPDHNAVVKRPGFKLKKDWIFDAKDRINGALALSGDTLFVDTFGNELIALDARSGKVVWRAGAPNTLMSTPVVGDGLVYVGTGDNDFLHEMPSTGTSRPMIASHAGLLWGKASGDVIMAFDARTGEQRWSYKTVGEDMPSAGVVDGSIVFANGDGHAYRLDSNGQLLWKTTLHGISTMASATVVPQGVLLSACNYALTQTNHCETYLIDSNSGAVIWTAPYGNADSSPAFAQGRVYVSGLEDATDAQRRIKMGYATLACLDVRSGKLLWKFRTPAPGLYSSVASAERAVAGTHANGRYYQAFPSHDLFVAFDAVSGRPAWQFRSVAPIKMSALVHGRRVYVGDTAGVLYVLDESTGALIRTLTATQPFSTAPPLIVGQTLYFVAGQRVFAMNVPV